MRKGEIKLHPVPKNSTGFLSETPLFAFGLSCGHCEVRRFHHFSFLTLREQDKYPFRDFEK